MSEHFVCYLSPGTFVSETTYKKIPSRDVKRAIEMAYTVVERHGATPYAFYFVTKEEDPKLFETKVTSYPGLYFLGGKISSIEEVEKRNNPEETVLLENMRNNNWNFIIENTNSYKFTAPFRIALDVLLPFTPKKISTTR